MPVEMVRRVLARSDGNRTLRAEVGVAAMNVTGG